MCLTLCDPIDNSPARLLCPWDSPGKNTGVGCHFLLQCMHACMLSRFSRVQLCATLWTAAHQAPLSKGFSRQEYWSGLPFPIPSDNTSSTLKLETKISYLHHLWGHQRQFTITFSCQYKYFSIAPLIELAILYCFICFTHNFCELTLQCTQLNAENYVSMYVLINLYICASNQWIVSTGNTQYTKEKLFLLV